MSQAKTRSDTRSRILEIAETQFARKGYEGAHLQSIAEEVGVQKTALYYYFASKAELYVSVLREMLENLDSALADALEAEGPYPERMARLLDGLNEILSQRRNYALILIRIFTDEVQADMTPLRDLVEGVIGRILTFYYEGAEAGEFRNLSSRHVFQSLLGLVFFHYASQGFSSMVLGVEDIFAADTVKWRGDEVRSMLFHGVLTRSDEPS